MTAPNTPPTTSRVRWPFIIGAVLGWAFIAVGIRGALHESNATRPFELVKWLAGLLLAHDLVLAPLAYGVGWITTRRRGLGPVQVALAVTVVVGAIAWPLVRGYGKRSDNPTLLPLDYTRNLVVTLVVVWVLALAFTAARALRRSPPPEGAQ
jgi:ABC-type branched-subunit amino acid transport system permease subunit